MHDIHLINVNLLMSKLYGNISYVSCRSIFILCKIFENYGYMHGLGNNGSLEHGKIFQK